MTKDTWNAIAIVEDDIKALTNELANCLCEKGAVGVSVPASKVTLICACLCHILSELEERRNTVTRESN